MLAINVEGLRLIKNAEGLRLTAYPDPGSPRGRAMQVPMHQRPPGWEGLPGAPWTIGYGHTGPKVKEGMSITEAEAVELLRGDVAWAEKLVRDNVRVPLNVNQFSALVSFCFNVGPGNPKTFRPGFLTSTLLKSLNLGDYDAAAAEFRKWSLASGIEMPGLVRRRLAEAELFRKPVE